jgi:hypothetical protein
VSGSRTPRDFGLALFDLTDPLLSLVIEEFAEIGGLDHVGSGIGFAGSARIGHPGHRKPHHR